MATHSSILAWRIPGMGEPDGLPSMGSHRVGHNWSDLTAAAFHMEMETSIVPLLLLYSFVYIYIGTAALYTHTHACMLSRFNHAQLLTILWTAACQAPLSMGFSRQEYWSGLPCPPPGVFLTQGLNSHLVYFLHWQVGSLPLAPPGNPINFMETLDCDIDALDLSDLSSWLDLSQTLYRWWDALPTTFCQADRTSGCPVIDYTKLVVIVI